LILKPFEKVSLYGNYIEGLSQGPTAPAGTTNAGQIFPPFKSRQMEAGVKVDFGNITTTLSFFQITRPSAFTNSATNTYTTNGEQRNRGIEFETFGELTDGLRLLGGVMLLDARLTKTAGGLYDGNIAVNSPKTNLNLGAEWDTPFVPGLTLTGRAIYTSSLYLDQGNTQSIPDWTRFDLGVRYKFTGPWNQPTVIRFDVQNVLDKSYWSSSSMYLGAPRMFLLSTTMNF